MAAIVSLYFAATVPASERKSLLFSSRPSSMRAIGEFQFKPPNSISRQSAYCAASPPGFAHGRKAVLYCVYSSIEHAPESCSSWCDPPTVAETKLHFLKSYKRPIPSLYNNVLQDLLIQQHLMRYKRTYQYDAVFALGFVTIYEQLMEGFPSLEDHEAIFKAYIEALREDPEQYRDDAKKLEEWGRSQDAVTLVDFSSRGGDVESILKGIAERVQGIGNFSYSRFFAVGIFRLLELANAAEPLVLEKFCAALKINKRSVDRDLDVYRNLLCKLVQAKELLKEYVDREKKKREERMESRKANEAITNCVGVYQFLECRF